MRAFRLIALAAQAEGLLLRRQGALMGRAAVMGAAAAAFGLSSLGLLHIAGWIWLEATEGALMAALWLALVDAFIAGCFFFLARPQSDPVANEALLLREQTLSMLTGTGLAGKGFTGTGTEAGKLGWERLALEALGVVVERWLKR